MATIENARDFDTINSRLRTARFLVRSDRIERARAESALLEMQFLSTLEESEVTEEIQNRFVDAIERGEEAALAATRIGPRNYLNWITGGYVYETLGELGVENGHEQATRFYAQARTEHPTNPEIPLIQARLEIARENKEQARVYARESIDMKRSYINAYTFIAQIELESGREVQALTIFEEGARANPNSQALQYELGAFHYRLGNLNRAVDAFGRAIEIEPGYANALYFRGLALYSLGDKEASLADLEKVLSTNENNQDLVRVVNNVRANRDALMGLDQSGEGSLPRSESRGIETNEDISGGQTQEGGESDLTDTQSGESEEVGEGGPASGGVLGEEETVGQDSLTGEGE
jgi:tetratricopeptide (TPR) repeat protein